MRQLPIAMTAMLALLLAALPAGCTRLPLYVSALPIEDEGGLESQRVVVQCISPRDSYNDFRPGAALARRIAQELKDEGATVVIDSSNRLRDEEAPGAALLDFHNADQAILVQIDDFRLHDESDSYRGRTAYTLSLYKAAKPATPVLEQRVAGYTYPEDGAVDARRTSQAAFRSEFLSDMATQVARSLR